MRLVSYRRVAADDTPWRSGIVVSEAIVDAVDCSPTAVGDVSTVRRILGLDEQQRRALAAAAAAGEGLRRTDVVLGPPVPDPDKILCIGLNYTEHAEETDLDPSAVPTCSRSSATRWWAATRRSWRPRRRSKSTSRARWRS